MQEYFYTGYRTAFCKFRRRQGNVMGRETPAYENRISDINPSILGTELETFQKN
jgi:hypothetical protein